MRDRKGFDLWADTYDQSVRQIETSNNYPFAGYREVLSGIYTAIREQGTPPVLDIGFGTGTLTRRLYDDGCDVCGVDYSREMIGIAREKMKNALLIQHDISAGLPKELEEKRFGFIVSTYAIHHLSDEQKVPVLRSLLDHLTPGGAILLGDISFETRADLDACRAACGEAWDSAEYYIVADELRRFFPRARFQKISFCAGITTITP